MAMIMNAPLNDWKSIQNEATKRSRDTNSSEIRNQEQSVVNQKVLRINSTKNTYNINDVFTYNIYRKQDTMYKSIHNSYIDNDCSWRLWFEYNHSTPGRFGTPYSRTQAF